MLDHAPLLRQLLLPLLLGELGQPGLEDPHRGLLVRRLGALVLALDDDAGRQVRDPDGGVGLVDVLAAGALRAIGVDSQVALVDLDVAVLREQRRGNHLRERRVAPVRLVEGAQADEPVLAALRPEDPVGVLALDGEGCGLEAGFFAGARLDDLGLEAAVVGPALVHAQEHLGEVLRVRAADVGLQRHDRVAGVVLAAEERLLLQAFELLPQRRDRGGDLSSIPPSIEKSSCASS